MNIEQFKKANKQRREQAAKKAGYASAQDFLTFLMGGGKTSPKGIGAKPIIHSITILDASGSMEGGKYENAKMGILTEIEHLKKDREVEWRFSMVEFVDNYTGVKEVFSYAPIAEITTPRFNGATGRDTPLYKTVYNTLTKWENLTGKNDKVLVKVYTDGQNNAAYEYETTCKQKIKELEDKGFTITFVATERDMSGIVRSLNLEESNTFAVQDSAAGFNIAFSASLTATKDYAQKVRNKQDVKKGFYKKVGVLS